MTFDESFAIVLKHEGGFQANPADKGNWTGGRIGRGVLKGTKWGISAAAYPELDIKGLTQADAKEIYLRDYWRPAGCDFVPEAVRFDLFDMAVHSGPAAARETLQRALGVEPDGVIGRRTRAAIEKADPGRLLARFNGWRLQRMTRNPTVWAEFGRGWAIRIADNLKRI
jgi:lysozyme family protein